MAISLSVSVRGRRPARSRTWPSVREVCLLGLGVARPQRGRVTVGVTAADREAAEAAYGPCRATAWHFRNAWYEARKSWDRRRAEIGGATLDAALAEPPLLGLALGPGAGTFGPDR